MVEVEGTTTATTARVRKTGNRLVSSKFPPIDLFDDVADADEFAVLFELQRLTNPRILVEVGALGLIDLDEIPFGITGCSYAVAPFTHVNPDGSRFSDGSFGVLYIAEHMSTAVQEVRYHQQRYLEQVEGLAFDRLVFRGLRCEFEETLEDITHLDSEHPIYNPTNYQISQALGRQYREKGSRGLVYGSVRNAGAVCWALFTPRGVSRIIQEAHYEMIWDGKQVSAANKLSLAG